MKYKIAHSKPTISTDEAKVVANVIRSNELVQGKKVEEFENRFQQTQEIKYAAATNTGTSALHLALLALNVKKGDCVMIPSYVCTALLNAVNYTLATPIVVDVNEGSFNISIEAIKNKLNRKVKAIIVPHMFGLPADMKTLVKLGVPIIEDCAQSIGARYMNKLVGNFGRININSFYATKMITTAEGGMVSSNNFHLINIIKKLRSYDQQKNYQTQFNYKMTDLQASMGVIQLSKLKIFIKKRQTIAKMYNHALKNLAIRLPHKEEIQDHIYYRYVIKVNKNQKKLVKYLNKNGIGATSPVYKPLHQYLNLKDCPVSEKLSQTSISLPVYPSLTKKDVNYICEHIKKWISQ